MVAGMVGWFGRDYGGAGSRAGVHAGNDRRQPATAPPAPGPSGGRQ
jgi:hypothetical protein